MGIAVRHWNACSGIALRRQVSTLFQRHPIERTAIMFRVLVEKELRHYLLDWRFVGILVSCVTLSVLGVYSGVENYLQELEAYSDESELYRNRMQNWVADDNYYELGARGVSWTRPPQPLAAIVYGLTGGLGREVTTRFFMRRIHEPFVNFESSPLEKNPVPAVFGVLDLEFVVRVLLSVAVILLTYDAVCGEKEEGTLRLCASFPVRRSTIALSKLAGSAVALLIPLVLSFLLAALVLSALADVELTADHWLRFGCLLVLFAIYLLVFAGWGIWFSSLARRRSAAFLWLLGLWALWVFVIPGAAVRIARYVVPVPGIDQAERQADAWRWEAIGRIDEGLGEHIDRNMQHFFDRASAYNRTVDWDFDPRETRWDDLSDAKKEALRVMNRYEGPVLQIWDRGMRDYHERIRTAQTERRNLMRRQQKWAEVLAGLSPVASTRLVAMDLAQTGVLRHERLVDAVSAYQSYFTQFIWKVDPEFGGLFRIGGTSESPTLSGFTPFSITERDPVSEAMARNALSFLNLVILAILGFAGAYVAILRYDVR